MGLRYFEDYEVGKPEIMGSYTADKQEFMELARKWDPQFFHVDEEAAKDSIYGGLIAPHLYTMAICNWIGNQAEPGMASLGMLGYERIQYPNPVRHGDCLTLTSQAIKKKESKTKPDRGVMSFRGVMTNQDGETVMAMDATVMVMRRA